MPELKSLFQYWNQKSFLSQLVGWPGYIPVRFLRDERWNLNRGWYMIKSSVKPFGPEGLYGVWSRDKLVSQYTTKNDTLFLLLIKTTN